MCYFSGNSVLIKFDFFLLPETLFFYKCLNIVGSDFAMISKYFPGCSRRQIKLKFKLEEKRNPLLVDKAFRFKSSFDTTELDEEFGMYERKITIAN